MATKTLLFANIKGGTAKTASTLGLSGALTECGKRVLVIDMDWTGACSTSLSIPRQAKNLADALTGEVSLEEITVSTEWGFDVVPSGDNLNKAASDLASDSLSGWDTVLRELIAETDEKYDHVIIDTPAAGSGVMTTLAFTAAGGGGELIITSQAQGNSILQADETLRVARKASKRGPAQGLVVRGLLLTMVRPWTIGYRDMLAAAQSLDLPLIGQIPFGEDANKSVNNGVPLFGFAPKSAVADAYRDLAGTLLGETTEITVEEAVA
jgi:cellulose biosynthesis protein BcsQ